MSTHSIFASLELLPNLPFPVMVMSMGVEDTDQVPGSSNPWGGETGSKAGHGWALSLPCQSSSLHLGSSGALWVGPVQWSSGSSLDQP